MQYTPISRRQLLKVTGVAAVGSITFSLQSCTNKNAQTNLGLYLSVQDENFTFILPRSEMGQDISSTFAMLIAEELEAPLESINVTFANASSQIPSQMTVASSSVRAWWLGMRQVGANTKALLIEQASKLSGFPPEQLIAKDGSVWSPDKTRKYTYSELAKQITSPGQTANAPLKSDNSFKLIGHSQTSISNLEKVTGHFDFLGDTESEFYVVSIAYKEGWARPKPHRLTQLSERYKLTNAFAVSERVGSFDHMVFLIGDKTWSLLKAKLELESEKRLFVKSLPPDQISGLEKEKLKLSQSNYVSAQKISLAFETPAIAHAPMEPPCGSIQFSDSGIEVWAPTQAPDKAREAIAKRLNSTKEKISLHTVAMGGAFGRKRYADYLEELAIAGKHLFSQGTSAKLTLIWTREDELNREFYRPATLQQVKWQADTPNKLNFSIYEGFSGAQDTDPHPTSTDLPLDIEVIAHKSMRNHYFSSGIWRAVYHGYQAFALCSAIDEICKQGNEDSLSYYLSHPRSETLKSRLKNLARGNSSLPDRLKTVIRRVESMSSWAKSSNQLGIGFSAYTVFGSHIALVAKVTLGESHQLQVDQLWAAIDCGIPINPDKIKAQVEGGLLYGLSACLHGEIPDDKDSTALNFDSAPVLRLHESPQIVVEIIESTESPTGVGELGVPVVAPAICNAIRTIKPYRFTKFPLIKAGKINYDNAFKVLVT